MLHIRVLYMIKHSYIAYIHTRVLNSKLNAQDIENRMYTVKNVFVNFGEMVNFCV